MVGTPSLPSHHNSLTFTSSCKYVCCHSLTPSHSQVYLHSLTFTSSCKYAVTPSHLHIPKYIFTPSYLCSLTTHLLSRTPSLLCTYTLSLPHTVTSSHPHTFPVSLLHTVTLSHLPVYHSYTPSLPYTFSQSSFPQPLLHTIIPSHISLNHSYTPLHPHTLHTINHQHVNPFTAFKKCNQTDNHFYYDMVE